MSGAMCPNCVAPWKCNGPHVPQEVATANDRQEGGTHYKTLKVQPWDAMEAWMSKEEFCGYLRGNCVKYIARCRDKGGLEDLKKARHYLDKLIETEGGGG